MVPEWGLIPVVLLATSVAVIASQAMITGAFSVAQQAMSLGLFPRMNIVHTSETEAGQIYVGQINWMIYIGVVLLVLVFQSSNNLANAYGVALITAMIIDSASPCSSSGIRATCHAGSSCRCSWASSPLKPCLQAPTL